MAERSDPSINQDAPRGPGRENGADPADAPALDRDEAARPAGGNRAGHEGRPGDPEGDPQPARRAARQGEDPTSAEAVIPSLRTDWRIQKGSDPDDPLAGIRAAAATEPEQLDESRYGRFIATQPGRWLSAGQLAERFGSFAAALDAAGVDDPARHGP